MPSERAPEGAPHWENILADLWSPIQDKLSKCLLVCAWSRALIDPAGTTDSFDSRQFATQLFPATLVSIGSRWGLLSAGHVVPNRAAQLEMGWNIVRPELICISRPGVGHIPFDYVSEQIIQASQPGGADFSLVPVPNAIATLLTKAGCAALPIAQIARREESFHFYSVTGIPTDHSRILTSDVGTARHAHMRIPWPSLPVEAVVDVPADLVDPVDPFVGRVVSRSGTYQDGQAMTLEDLAGMSGGPVFGYRLNASSVDLKLVGVQSKWSKTYDMIVAARVTYLYGFLADALKRD